MIGDFSMAPRSTFRLWGWCWCAVLLLMGCGERGPMAGPVEPEPISAPPAPVAVVAANDLDVSLIAADAFAAIAIFPQRLADRPWFTKLQAGEWFSEGAEWQTLNPLACRRLVVSLSPGTGTSPVEWVARADWAEPIDLEALLAEVPDRQVEERGGRRLHLLQQGEVAFYQASPTTIWGGDVDRLQASLEGRLPTGVLADRLRGEPCEGEVTMVMSAAPVQTLLLENLDTASGLGGVAGNESMVNETREFLERLRGITLTLDSTREKVGLLEIDFDDKAFAERIRDQARRQLAQWKLTLPTLIAFGAGRLPSDVNQAATALAFSLLAGIRFEAREEVLEASMTAPSGWDEHIELLVTYAGELAKREQRRARLVRVARALQEYRQAKGRLPGPSDVAGGLSWRVELLPYLGEQELYDSFRRDEPWNSEHNLALANRIPDVFRESDGSDQTAFLGLVGRGMALGGRDMSAAEAEATADDGLETTLAVIDTGGARVVTWTSSSDLDGLSPADLTGWGDSEDATVAVITADGEVRSLPKTIDPDTLKSSLTARGGESLEAGRLFPPELQRGAVEAPFRPRS